MIMMQDTVCVSVSKCRGSIAQKYGNVADLDVDWDDDDLIVNIFISRIDVFESISHHCSESISMITIRCSSLSL